MKTLRTYVAFFATFVACLAVAGCSGPEVTFNHFLSSDFPADEAGPEISPDIMRAGEYTVTAGPKEEYGKQMAEIVADRLSQRVGAVLIPKMLTIKVDGEIFIETGDKKSKRTIRRLRPDRKEVEFIEVDTLVRMANVRVVYTLINIDDGTALGGVEVRKNYSSLADPRVRGEWGLSRADNPADIPEIKTIVSELMGKCADSLIRMITPHVIPVKMTLKATATPQGKQGQAAAKKHAYAEAATLFKAAIEADAKDTGSLFNLAVMEELAGDLPAALEHYKKFLEQTTAEDKQAQEAVIRVKRLLIRIK